MRPQKTVSLIITSYNQAKTLRLLFASLARQSFRDFDVTVADDGSSDETAQLCADEKRFPLYFITQSDEGYRKSKILNEAIRQIPSDYLLFLDADVLLEKHFIEDHLSLQQPNSYVCGRRVDLGPDVSESIREHDIRIGRWDSPLKFRLIMSGVRKQTQNLKRGIRVKNRFLRKLLGYNRPLDILGSNLSVWRKDLLEVNGFNEALESYWGEDGDLFIRLRNAGKIAIGSKNLCIQYHIFHPRRTPTPENVAQYKKLLEDREYRWAKKGIGQNIAVV